MIWRSPDTKQAIRNKCIQRNDKSRWHSIIWGSPDTKQAKQNKRI
ncbi:hypothetical protein WMH17_02795 [Staphylococcus aureus]|nr:hypothetical protein [Staphylococcus aureus]